MLALLTQSAPALAALGAMLALLSGTPAQALGLKTYVSNTGNNANDCSSVALACASISQALSETLFGGEVIVVNAGAYGPASITKSVNITNDGAGEASVDSVSIGALAGDVVSLRGLVVDGVGFGSVGILITTASAVHIQNCVVRNFEQSLTGVGISLAPSGNTQLFVSDTVVFNNGSVAATGGIRIQPQGTGSARVVLDRVHLENNVIGLKVDGSQSTGNGARVVVRHSAVSGNAGDGILALSASGKAAAFILLEHTSSVNNGGTGIHADGPHATILLKENTITQNGTGIAATNGGQLISYGNNSNNNNIGPEGAPTSLFSPM